MIHLGEIVAETKFSLHLSVSYIKFGMGILTLEKFIYVLLANLHSYKSVVPCSSILSLKRISAVAKWHLKANETFFNIFLKHLSIFKSEYIQLAFWGTSFTTRIRKCIFEVLKNLISPFCLIYYLLDIFFSFDTCKRIISVVKLCL